MPSLRKRVTSYFRQLSFHNEPRDRHNINENSFVTKYLQGGIRLKHGPPVLHGKNPTDLPNYELGEYETGPNTIIGCYTGPRGGLTTVKRQEKHLSVPDAEDIDFIDTANEENVEMKLPHRKEVRNNVIDNTTMVIRVAGQEYCVTNRARVRQHSKSHSLGSLSDFGLVVETTKIDKEFYSLNQNNINNNNNCLDKKAKATEIKKEEVVVAKQKQSKNVQKKQQYNLAKSKSEGNPFQHQQKKKHGKIIKATRDTTDSGGATSTNVPQTDDSRLPPTWQRKSDLIYGISDSLYDRNQVTRKKQGDPIADCFGIISRHSSAILAVADGVNWGEKAAIAAKSAIHGALYYLNKTIFNDTQPFEENKSDLQQQQQQKVTNTREIFVCLLRAFSCAHELILENKGMLTTLTVAVVVPLKKRSDGTIRYVCCVCNVGDTLGYVYSDKYGLRELTKGSHDINCNRDMRDALGALGPVDGINPELSNLTLSVTTLNKGDLVMLASDGLTDNFDPNVCKFTVPASTTVTENPVRRPPPTQPNPIRPQQQQQRFLRSKTTIEVRSTSTRRRDTNIKPIQRNSDGLPLITPLQRYELQLLLMEDVLKQGISGKDTCTTAKQLCENLVSYTFSITAAKRHTLEDQDVYFNNTNGVLVEVSVQEQKTRRKKCLEKVQNLPGKLDHVSVVAWNVANTVLNHVQ